MWKLYSIYLSHDATCLASFDEIDDDFADSLASEEGYPRGSYP